MPDDSSPAAPPGSDAADGGDTTDAGTAAGAAAVDGGAPGFDEAALYRVVRAAVEDAILGVLGTLLLLGIAAVVVWVGVAVAFRMAGNPAGVIAGAGVAGWGFYIAAAALGVIPPIRKWL